MGMEGLNRKGNELGCARVHERTPVKAKTNAGFHVPLVPEWYMFSRKLEILHLSLLPAVAWLVRTTHGHGHGVGEDAVAMDPTMPRLTVLAPALSGWLLLCRCVHSELELISLTQNILSGTSILLDRAILWKNI